MESKNEQPLEVPPPYTEFPAPGSEQGQPPMGQPPMGQPPMGQPVYNSYPMVAQPQVIYQTSLPLDRKPMSMLCPRCNANVITETSFKMGKRGWKFFGLMCYIGFWCGCCLIPFFTDSMKDVDHHCPLCKAYIGRCIN